MVTEFLEMFDTVPNEEKCSELLSEQRKEARRYRDLILKLKPAPEGADLRIKNNPHDFGTYATIEAWGDSNNEAHWEWVNSISDIPETWEELDAAVVAMDKPPSPAAEALMKITSKIGAMFSNPRFVVVDDESIPTATLKNEAGQEITLQLINSVNDWSDVVFMAQCSFGDNSGIEIMEFSYKFDHIPTEEELTVQMKEFCHDLLGKLRRLEQFVQIGRWLVGACEDVGIL